MFVCEYDGYEYYFKNGMWTCIPVYTGDPEDQDGNHAEPEVEVEHNDVPQFVIQRARELMDDEALGEAYKKDLELGWVTDPEQVREAAEEESTLFEEVGGYGYDIDPWED